MAGSSPPPPPPSRPSGPRGWPAGVKLLLAAVIFSFVFSPFLMLLVRLAQERPQLEPTGGAPPVSDPGGAVPGRPAPSP
ncbi:MAG: hypothetical protein ACK55X_10310 [Synechococcaceae cyanobacterium]